MKHWFENGEDKERKEKKENVEAINLSSIAIKEKFVESEKEYYNKLHSYTVELAEERIEEEKDPTNSLINSIRSLETIEETENEINERIKNWEGGLSSDSKPKVLEELKDIRKDLNKEKNKLKDFAKQEALEKAPNMSNLSPPLLSARLIEKAGGLKELARKPSSTVQVLGAENALFHHLKTGSPPPKHGLLYLHPEVNNRPKNKRGKAARILAGKLSIASRIDYYSGELNEDLRRELEDRLENI